MPVLIETRELSKSYPMGTNEVQALRGVSLHIDQGDFVAIMGASGSGKSTFMNLLGCLDQASSGQYFLAGQEVSRKTADELADLRNRYIGFVFQQFNLLPRTSALEQVELPLMYAGMSAKERRERARQCLYEVGLSERMHHLPTQLSGGQQQRVAIARALVNRPALILADEPTGALDTQTSAEVMHLLTRFNQQGMTIVLVTHEPDIADYARRKIVFRDGQVVEDKTS
jgi:putative ABC transport system ATP-binding protein